MMMMRMMTKTMMMMMMSNSSVNLDHRLVFLLFRLELGLQTNDCKETSHKGRIPNLY